MGTGVFANGRSISCKAAPGKSIAAFPDVCFTPPQTPATPPGVPIPYPNTGMSSDTDGGSKDVKIGGKEVMLKNKSSFKKTVGNEAGCAPKKGVVTSKNTGKAYFNAWSFDVKVEDENVVRHLDLTTQNHGSMPGNTPPWMHADEMAMAVQAACQDELEAAGEACAGSTPSNCSTDCKKAQKCLFVAKKDDKNRCCAPGNTGHHLVEDHWVKGNAAFPSAQGSAGYGGAPTLCVEGGRFTKEHGEMHNVQGLIEESHRPGGSRAGQPWDYNAAKRATLTAHDMAFGDSNCSHACMEAQIDSYYGEDGSRPMNAPQTQSLAQNDPKGDGRWLRPDAHAAMGPFLGGS